MLLAAAARGTPLLRGLPWAAGRGLHLRGLASDASGTPKGGEKVAQ